MKNHRLSAAALAIAGLGVFGAGKAAPVEITMNAVTANGIDKPIGTVTVSETSSGVRFTPALKDLPAGEHGFHVHAKPSCDPAPDPDKGRVAAAAFGAGGHFDPAQTSKHEGPEGMGHKGDLPALTVAANGTATKAVDAPHLKLADLGGHALMIHAGGDNYSDQPQKLGGGGARIACGVIR